MCMLIGSDQTAGKQSCLQSLQACFAWLWGGESCSCRHTVSAFTHSELTALACGSDKESTFVITCIRHP